MKPASPMSRLASCLTAMLVSTSTLAAGQVSSIEISVQPATPFSYTLDGFDYNWGRGKNQLIEGFIVEGRSFGYFMSADEVIVRRDDIIDVTSGEPCGIFVEALMLTERSRDYAADFPQDASGSGNCNLEALLKSRIINRGVVDAFSNKKPDAKNIERLDYLFHFGALAPLSQGNLNQGGHVVAEKRGNNPVKVAAILSLDSLGQPSEYGQLVTIAAAGCAAHEICYGETDLMHTYSFLQNEFNAPQGLPAETERSLEAVNMAFVSAADLGLTPGQRYHGFSIFADDVDSDIHTLIDPQTFPDDTADDYVVEGDDADIYGGLTGYFLSDDIASASGALFLDVDLDGVPDSDEAGVSDVTVVLYIDVNGNGIIDEGVDQQVGDSLLSGTDGSFVFPGLPDGNYLVAIDSDDAQIPQGLVVAPGTNPQPLTVAGTNPEPVNFSFVSGSGTGSGSEQDDGGVGVIGSDGDETEGAGGDETEGAGGDETEGAGGDETEGAGGDETEGAGGDETEGAGGDETEGAGGDETEGAGGDETEGAGGDETEGAGGDETEGAGGDESGDNGPSTTSGETNDNDGDGSQNDDATAANSDEFDVNQGSIDEILPVLENDVDGTDTDSLTITSVSESSNATISFVNNEVVYTPNYGYFSPEGDPDTFSYTMEDSENTTRTGNVSVNVVRFSDLNNNGENDFVECNCTDLVLETGVNGAGIGHMSKWFVLALLLLGLWRLQASPLHLPAIRKGGK